MHETFTAWAIDSRSDDGHGLVGRYWPFYVRDIFIPLHMEGCKFALFTTRKLARKFLPNVRGAFPRASVVKVSVEIKEAMNG